MFGSHHICVEEHYLPKLVLLLSSSKEYVGCGVPQGFALSPLLFLNLVCS